MIDHLGIHVRDLTTSGQFYGAALQPLGYELLMEFDDAKGFGIKGDADFWLERGEPPSGQMHVAFRARDHAAVERFYEIALASGGRDNGAPGLRPDYGPDYFAAFVIDPDGYNIEAVYRT